MAHQEMLAVCSQLEVISDQLGWCEAWHAVEGRNYFFNRHLNICTWERRDPHGQALIQVGLVVETNEDIQTNGAENGYEGALQKGTQIEILYVGENGAEAGYLFGEVCDTKHRVWLSFTCIRAAGCQCPLDLEDVATPPFPAIEHQDLFLPRASLSSSSRQPLDVSQIPEVWTRGYQPSLNTAPSAFAH